MKWIGPLFTNAGGWAAFVSYHNGEWYIDQDNPTKIGEGRSPIMLLPILQKGYGENYDHQIALIQSGLKAIGMEEKLAYGFPFHVPVLAAFELMPHWADMAADWVSFIELNNERAQMLFDACQDKAFSQKARHAVLKIVNAWAKKRGFSFVRGTALTHTSTERT
jgi:hypothetical protein